MRGVGGGSAVSGSGLLHIGTTKFRRGVEEKVIFIIPLTLSVLWGAWIIAALRAVPAFGAVFHLGAAVSLLPTSDCDVVVKIQ